MRTLSFSVVVIALCLSACNRPKDAEAAADASNRGRFNGVGIYQADRMWSQVAGVEQPKSLAAARLKDDQQVIVVVDSHTGEIRQCGNISGFCVGMNPWSKPLPPAQAAPLSLLKHEEDLERESERLRAEDEKAAKADWARASSATAGGKAEAEGSSK